MGGPTVSSGVGACEYALSPAPPPFVPSVLSVPISVSDRSANITDSVRDLHDSANLGSPLPI